MTNIEIAKILLKKAKEGKLEQSILPHFMNSLQFGGPVPNPQAWLRGIAKDLPEFIVSDQCRDQLRDIADRWEEIASGMEKE